MNPDRLGLASMMEVKLGELKQITMLDREAIDKVIHEQKLKLLFNPEATARRVAVGKMLKADLLLFLRDRKRPGQLPDTQPSGQQVEGRKQGIDLAVAETTRGLRLVMSTAIWNPEKVEAIADEFIKQVRRACDLTQQPELKVFAVPALECKDILPGYACQRRAFARLFEEFLVGKPGVVVVELSEAQALSRELAIGGTSIVRGLPYYLIGTYKSNSTNGEVSYDLSIDLRQGQASIETIERSAVNEKQLGQTLKAAVRDLLPEAGSKPTSAEGVDEVELLLQRAGMFRRLVEWDEAIPLYESVLLLDPNNINAHRKLLAGYWYMAESGAKYLPDSPYNSIASRVHFSKHAYSHAFFLLRRRDLVPEVINLLSKPVNYLHGYENDSRYESLREELVNAVKPVSDEIWDILRDPNLITLLRDEKTKISLLDLGITIVRANSLCFPGERLQRDYDLLVQLEKLGASYRVLMLMTYRWLADMKDDSLFELLEQDSSQRLQHVGYLSRLASQVADQADYEHAFEQATQYVEVEVLEAKKHKTKLMDKFSSMALCRMLITEFDQSGKQDSAPAESSDIFLPQLTRLNDRLLYTPPDSSLTLSTPDIRDWVSCGPGVEVVVLDSGLYRLSEGDKLEHLATVIPADRSTLGRSHDYIFWDGRFLWILAIEPKEAIIVVDLDRGVIAQFDENELLHGIDIGDGQLTCVRPGQALFYGCYKKPSAPLRTWAVLLEVEIQNDGIMSKRFDRFYEARERLKSHKGQTQLSAIDRAYVPYWMITIPAEVEPAGPWVMVWRMPQALILDIPRRQARLAKAYWPPYTPLSLYPYDGFILLDGQNSLLDGHGMTVQWADHPDSEPTLIMDWGERMRSSGIGFPYDYAAATMHEGWLHVLNGYYYYHNMCAPSWVAINPKTWDIRILAGQFQKKWSRGDRERLRVSERYGLIYLNDFRWVYQVKLPPVELWPKMETVDIPASQPVGEK